MNCIKTKCIHGSASRSVLGALEGYLYYKLKTYDYINHFICPSRFIADKLVEFGINPARIEVLPNFIRGTKPLGDIPKRKHFMYFGRISEEKGIRILVAATKLLPEIKFVIAGSGPLEYLLSDLPNVEFVGFKREEELREMICQSIATICPSQWYENSPLSVLESLGLNIPVIASNIGGIPEIIEDKWNGLLFEAGNIDDLASKINIIDQMLLRSFDNIARVKHSKIFNSVTSGPQYVREVKQVFFATAFRVEKFIDQ
jgi:glycosyltransferase involved in cell wall biosynthesis